MLPILHSQICSKIRLSNSIVFTFYVLQAKPAVDYSDLLNQKRQQEIRHRNSADVFARDAGTSGGILRSSTRQIFVHQNFF